MPITSHTTADVTWEPGDTPRSIEFDDPYYSLEDGRAETRHVFIGGNQLPERWSANSSKGENTATARNFTIAELGFGTGLNFLETLHQWRSRPGVACTNHERLNFVSFERNPLSAADLARALSHWPDLQPDTDQLLKHWPPASNAAVHEAEFSDATLQIHLGDANETLPAWTGTADAWYLDGFSPAKNSALWNADLMAAVFAHTVPGGTFATYTVAGLVRRNLLAAGFEVARIKGFGRKRESLTGHRLA